MVQPRNVRDLHTHLTAFDALASKGATPKQLQHKWKELFGVEMTEEAADAFVAYYRDMKHRKSTRRSSRKAQRQGRKTQMGGSASLLAPASLDYTMTPGSYVPVYAKFPTEVATDPSSLRDLDVFFQDSLTKSCGNPTEAASFPTPPTDMGSNQVPQAGGKRKGSSRSRSSSRSSKSSRKGLAFAARKSRKSGSRKNRRQTYRRRQRGGDLLSSLSMRPFLADPYPNAIQQVHNQFSGSLTPVPFPSAPEQHAWGYQSHGTAGVINPGLITPVGADYSKFASPPPWQTTS